MKRFLTNTGVFLRRFGGSPRSLLSVVVAMLMFQAAALTYLARMYSPTPDEIGYLPAGISHWRDGRFELFRANPHLVRMIAALPVLAMEYRTDWRSFDAAPGARSDLRVGMDFLQVNGENSFRLFFAARLACIPLVLLGGVVCWRWAGELYGPWPAAMAAALWCVCPHVLGNGALITPDAATTSLGALAAYLFWKWLREPAGDRAFYAGLALGFAELAKTNWLVLYGLWPVLWVVWQLANRALHKRALFVRAGQLGFIVLTSVFVLNAGYGFDGTFKRLGKFEFVSPTLRGLHESEGKPKGARPPGNRFRDGWLGNTPVPLPEQYVLGIDTQREAVESARPAYLWGVWKRGGWWYYYLAAMCVKVPVGTLLLVALALGTRLCGVRFGPTWQDELVLLAPALATLLFISSQSGINRHFAMPCRSFLSCSFG